MSVLFVNPITTGLADVKPYVIQIKTNDTFADVQAPGYLNASQAVYGNVYSDLQMALVYTTDDGPSWLRVTISNGNTSLVPINSAGTVSSVGITGNDFNITNSPITSSGNINLALKIVTPSLGGTGVANSGTITVGNNVSFVGNFPFIGNLSNSTNIIFPTTGTLATTTDIPSFPLSPANGGTGVNNGASTITIGDSVIFNGGFTSQFNFSGTTSVNFPTSGTLATVGGTISAVNGTVNQIDATPVGTTVTLSLDNAVIMPGTLTLSADPTTPLQAATKQYVDAIAMGLTFKTPCYASTTGSNLTATFINLGGPGDTLTNSGTNAAFLIDGVNPPANSRILVKDQTTTFQNGVYTLTTVGTTLTPWILTRATDYNTAAQIHPGDLFIIENGTLNGDTSWVQTATVVTMDVSPISFTQFTYASPVLSVSGTLNRVISSGGQNPVIDIASNYVGQTSITTLGVIGTGVWQGSNVGLGFGGTNAALTASAGSLVYSTSTAMAFSAVGSTGQIIMSQGTSPPTWSSATYPASTTANQLLYSSANNIIAGLTSISSGVLTTSNVGVPIFATTLPTPVQGNITQTGALTSGSLAAGFTAVTVALGGTSSTSFTPYMPICGGTGSTTALQSVAVGTLGYVLTYVSSSSLPTWQNLALAAVTSIAGTTNQITASASVGSVTLSLPTTFITPGTLQTTGLATLAAGVTVTGAAANIGTDAADFAVNIGTGVSAGRTTTIGNTTGTSGIIERVGTGNYSLNGAASSTYSFGLATTTGTFTIGGTAQTGTITLGSSSGTSIVAIGNGAGQSTVNIANVANTGAVNIGAGFTSGTITVGGTAQTGLLTIGSSSGTNIVAIGSGAGATTVNIAAGATNAKAVNIATGAVANIVAIGSTTGVASLALNAGSGGINMTGTVNVSTIAASSAVATDASKNLVASSTSAAELGFVHGVTSSIQAQLNAITGGYVTSITGTTQQITASSSTGAVTLSIPTTFVAPGSVKSTTLLTSTGGATITGAALNLGTDSADFAVNIGTAASAGRTITIGNSTGTSGIVATVGTGNFSLDGVGASTYTIGASATTGTITIGGLSQTGTIFIGAGTVARTIQIGSSTGAATINIGAGATNGKTISIGTGAAPNTVSVGSTNTTSTLNLSGGSGGIVMNGSLFVTSYGSGGGVFVLQPLDTVAVVTTLTIDYLNLPKSIAGHNLLFNGAMHVWQRGISFSLNSSVTSLYTYTADRWQFGIVAGAGQWQVSRVAGPTSGTFYLQMQRTSGNSSGAPAFIGQTMTIDICADVPGQVVTISFTALCGTTAHSFNTLTVSVVSGTGSTDVSALSTGFTGATAVVSQNATLTTTAQTFSFTSSVLGAGVTQLAVEFGVAPTGTAASVDYVQIRNVQLEVSTKVTNFQEISFTEDLTRCQSFYQYISGMTGNASSTGAVQFGVQLSPSMRAVPTVSATGPICITNGAANITQSSFLITNNLLIDGTGGLLGIGNYSGLVAQTAYVMNASVNSNVITFDAELT